MEDYQCAQVSFNLTDFHRTNLHDIFEACWREAATRKLKITGSELIGLVPQEALLQAGKFYAPKEQKEDVLIDVAVDRLLLSKIRPFKANERILEKCLVIN